MFAGLSECCFGLAAQNSLIVSKVRICKYCFSTVLPSFIFVIFFTLDSRKCKSNACKCSIPFSIDDLADTLQVKEFSDVEPVTELLENPAFEFLHE